MLLSIRDLLVDHFPATKCLLLVSLFQVMRNKLGKIKPDAWQKFIMLYGENVYHLGEIGTVACQQKA